MRIPVPMNANRFIHLESLENRSAATEESVRFHVHVGLHQICCFTEGSGEVIAEGRRILIAAPCVLAIPAGVTHGVLDVSRCRGLILTFSDDYLRQLPLNEPGFQAMYAESAWLAELEDGYFEAGLRRLGLELAWAANDHAVTVKALLTALQVELLRLYRHVRRDIPIDRSRHSQLVTQFRELVESHFRDTHTIETYAGWLGVTARRLRDACVAATGRRPTEIISERLGLEAGCIMSYSDRSITNVGRHLGFENPSHFSRFFSKVFAVSPRRFRSDVQRGSTVPCGKAH